MKRTLRVEEFSLQKAAGGGSILDAHFHLALIGLNEYRELLREQWRGPHTWMMVNFYDSEPPDARRRRTIADVFFSPEAIEFLAEPS